MIFLLCDFFIGDLDKRQAAYEKRGKKDGYDLDDWLRAEQIVTRNRIRDNIKMVAELAGIIVIIISFCSYKATLQISNQQLEQAKELYELQNKPILTIEEVGWYPQKSLADVALRIRMRIYNHGKSITNEARVLKDIVLRIKTDTLQRFPNFLSDIRNISEHIVDVDKDKRIQEYVSYRKKPFEDISKYISETKDRVTSDEIIAYFSNEYKEKGYEFIKYSDSVGNSFIVPPGYIDKETSRSISIADFENEILKDGGDILVFYYAIEYIGPLKTKKYVIHYIGCYESLEGRKDTYMGRYWFPHSTSFSEEVKILKE